MPLGAVILSYVLQPKSFNFGGDRVPGDCRKFTIVGGIILLKPSPPDKGLTSKYPASLMLQFCIFIFYSAVQSVLATTQM